MPEPQTELDLHPTESPFWKENQDLTELEFKAMLGTRSMSRVVQFRSRIRVNNFEELSKDLFEEIFRPFGHGVREYRESNTRVLGGKLKYPDHYLVPKYMRDFNVNMLAQMREVEENPTAEKVIALAGKAHALVYIHPFADGNGRVSRALANYVLLHFGYIMPSWRFAGREAYLNAVADGWDNPKRFEKFITQALVRSYEEREARLGQSRFQPLVSQREQISSIKQSLSVLLNTSG